MLPDSRFVFQEEHSRFAVSRSPWPLTPPPVSPPPPPTAGKGGKAGGYQHVEGHKASAEYLNLGGPYGITYASGELAGFREEGNYNRTAGVSPLDRTRPLGLG
ncbi:hypothetical protein ACFWRF_29430, partial [Streptomyces sp. NPDC058542]